MRTLLFALASLTLSLTPLYAVEYAPRDWEGQNLVLGEGDTIWGTHTNVHRFEVPGGHFVPVKPYDGEDAATGRLRIEASEIFISGTLTASGAGYTGGGGGGGGAQGSTGGSVPGGLGGQARYDGDGTLDGQQGGAGTCIGQFCTIPVPGIGGKGGRGDGPYGGAGDQPGDPYQIFDGGYLAPGGNGDTSTDSYVAMGSGGGGGAGTSGHGAIGPTLIYTVGGDGGGSGGGAIELLAQEILEVRQRGRILANGTLGERSNFAAGGDSLTESLLQEGPGGGAGAGGGIVLFCLEPTGIRFEQGAIVETLGGRGSATNGGTLKVLTASSLAPDVSNLVARVGRIYTAGLGSVPLEFAPRDWQGQDLTLPDGAVIWGTHKNLGRVTVSAGARVKVLPFDGSDPATGMVRLEAREAVLAINSTLDATGAGYTGGGGGGGGHPGVISSLPEPGGEGGEARYGGIQFRGGQGGDGSCFGIACLTPVAGSGGDGASGNGPHAGVRSTVPANRDGGYGAPRVNGDTSTGGSVWMGSGGAGVDGEDGGPHLSDYGRGGDGGGSGGGMIQIIATDLLGIGHLASIQANGTGGARGVIMDGGDSVIPLGGQAGNGGAGAGGGILLFCHQADGFEFVGGALVTSLGGSSGSTNGGTVKVLALDAEPSLEGLAVSAGRTYVARINAPTPTVTPSPSPSPTPIGTFVPVPGDANGDGAVTPGDAQALFDCFLDPACTAAGSLTDPCILGKDGILTPGDAQRLFLIAMGLLPPCS